VKILFFTNLTFCRTKFHPFFWSGLASGQRDALQARSSSRQEWPASVPACAAADSTAASNLPPDSTDATAKHRPCLVRQRTAFSHSEVPVILQSDSFSAKIKKRMSSKTSVFGLECPGLNTFGGDISSCDAMAW